MCKKQVINQHRDILYGQDKGITIIGSAGVEEVYTSSQGVGLHDIHTIALQERTYGGAGLCLAVAYAQAHHKQPIYFHSIAGEVDGKPDSDAVAIKKFLEAYSNILVTFQMKSGVVTEKNMILLQDGRRYGYRLGDTLSQLARESFATEDPTLTQSYRQSHSLIVTSLQPKVALKLFQNFASSQPGKLCSSYTINSSIARSLAADCGLQKKLSKVVDVICLSEEEFEAIGAYDSVLARTVPILYVTKGEQGGLIIHNESHTQTQESIFTSAFKVKQVRNDNGAGEAAHAAFIHTLITFKQHHICQKKLSIQRMLEISGYVGNVAGALKVQSKESLDFPSNLHASIELDECMNEALEPSKIGKYVLARYVQETSQRNYYSFTHEL